MESIGSSRGLGICRRSREARACRRRTAPCHEAGASTAQVRSQALSLGTRGKVDGALPSRRLPTPVASSDHDILKLSCFQEPRPRPSFRSCTSRGGSVLRLHCRQSSLRSKASLPERVPNCNFGTRSRRVPQVRRRQLLTGCRLSIKGNPQQHRGSDSFPSDLPIEDCILPTFSARILNLLQQ
jgi:hypothetical protein